MKGQVFSIAKFKDAFAQWRGRQFMSDMELEQVATAVEKKDVILLGTLYEILMEEKSTNEEIVTEFIMKKNRIVDGFMVEAREIQIKLIEKPLKQKMAHAQKREQKQAEKILEQL